MASFLHIADARQAKHIARFGIAISHAQKKTRGVFCFPVLRDYSITHQWARELKRSGVRVQVCVQFRIHDAEMVSLGRYQTDAMSLTAAEAISVASHHEAPFGLEVVIPRRVKPDEVTRIYPAPLVAGWRYYPEAKGRKPFCHCKYCNRGEIRAQRLIQEDN